MHELALSESVLQIVQDSAVREGFDRVTLVQLEIGALACVDARALRFSFGAVSHGTVADKAVLEIIAVPGRAWCPACTQHVSVAERFDDCPKCGSQSLTVVSGDEMKVKQLEVE